MKKILSLILALVMALSLVACGKKDETPDPVEDEQKPEGTVEVVWWTNYGDKNISYLQKTIDAFNASQSDYHVTIEYQGSAAELKAKVVHRPGRPARPVQQLCPERWYLRRCRLLRPPAAVC